jgi:hypothetical protein
MRINHVNAFPNNTDPRAASYYFDWSGAADHLGLLGGGLGNALHL